MILALWVILGSLLAIGTFLFIYATVELKKQNDLLAQRLKSHAEAAGLRVFKHGLGWVPADGTCAGH